MGSSAGSYTAAESHSSSCMYGYSNIADNNKATADGVVSKWGFWLQSHFGAVHKKSKFFGQSSCVTYGRLSHPYVSVFV